MQMQGPSNGSHAWLTPPTEQVRPGAAKTLVLEFLVSDKGKQSSETKLPVTLANLARQDPKKVGMLTGRLEVVTEVRGSQPREG